MASMKAPSNKFAVGAGQNAARTGNHDGFPADTPIVPSAPTGPHSGRPHPKASAEVGTVGRAALVQPRAPNEMIIKDAKRLFRWVQDMKVSRP